MMETHDGIPQLGVTPVRGALRKRWNLKPDFWAGSRGPFRRVAAFGLMALLAGCGLSSWWGCGRETASTAADRAS